MNPEKTIQKFQKTVWDYYVTHKRNLPWRRTRNPYRILVSEVMLQQTQVDRVVDKYRNFLHLFPTVQSLDKAPFRVVLQAWQGLGYNRRALYLKRIAEIIVHQHNGRMPYNESPLRALPGIGAYTARAVLAFARNEPVILIETNIRTVFLHHFFRGQELVHDREILPFIEAMLDRQNPREWYWALMDYGTMLKKQFGNLNRASAQHVRQSAFHGSNREIRGLILKMIATKSSTENIIIKKLGKPQESVRKNLHDLCREGFLRKQGRTYVV